ncbi:unnamed protein product [Paramecium octaurelia]|uniref:U4/U6.U5 tri-snRNP-associated protein 2 n=1 Tax=Paramecium octaurelia TaxID=43137 RepID=A0A8S1TZE1_PAROT|nr:unnamed protein product [Paramecium octaurelia]
MIDEIKKKVKYNQQCPYIATICRHMLDFDFEKLCSVTLSNLNVYVCLICGKYYQGKSINTQAYIHSLEQDHHLFMNLQNTKIYCLPDNYEVVDHSLEDIQYNLDPKFNNLKELDDNVEESRALDGTTFLPGFVGLNNLSKSDYFNVVMQALCRIKPLRNFMIFLQFQKSATEPFDYNCLLSQRFSELTRKIWNPRNYKGHVSPHELLQAVTLKSNKQFKIGQQSDPMHLIIWFLDNLKKELLHINKTNTIISDCFQGELQYEWYKPLKNAIGYQPIPIIEQKSFFYLSLDLPSTPLQKDGSQKALIPSISIQELIKKYDGFTNTDSADGRRRYTITKFPKYLIIHMKRFIKNNFFMEKNPTIVTFPLNDLDLSQCLNLEQQNVKYNLIANICHEGTAKVGIYKIHVKNEANNQWFQIQDLHKQNICK